MGSWESQANAVFGAVDIVDVEVRSYSLLALSVLTCCCC
jgi:hypothetical protein